MTVICQWDGSNKWLLNGILDLCYINTKWSSVGEGGGEGKNNEIMVAISDFYLNK